MVRHGGGSLSLESPDKVTLSTGKNQLTNHEFLHILFNRGNAGNGESTFLQGVREELPEG